MDHLITSAALYYPRQHSGSVPLRWFEAVSAFLAEKGVPAQIFVVNAPGFNFDRHYELARHREKLVRALRDGRVEDLALYSVPGQCEVIEFECVAEADVGYKSGNCFLGVERAVIDSPSFLLETALALAKDLPPILYGIGYHRPQSKGPSLYAVGCSCNPDPFEPENERIGEWGRERCQQNRHFTGMLRGAYPASILSDEHVDAVLRKTIWGREVTLRNAGLGTLKPLKEGLWLWELSEAEIPKAEAALEKAGLIIHN